jgi:long-chain acyl-CoA synthetase
MNDAEGRNAMSLEVPYRSIPDLLAQRVAATPDKDAFGYPTPDGGIGWLTWSQVAERTDAIAAGLIGLGVRSEDRVAILSSTRVEWLLADFGIMNAAGATTTVYPTTEPEDTAYILSDSESVILIAEDAKQVAKIAGATLPNLRQVVVIDGDAEPAGGVPTMTLAELEQRGRDALAANPDLVKSVSATVKPEHLATLIYTSGTTGRPKGVELLHAGWCWEAVAQSENELVRGDDLQYLWLPLSHSFGKTLEVSLVHAGLPTYVDGRVDKIVALLPVVRPTLMCAAPRIFEKIYNAVVGQATAAGGLKTKIFHWSVRVGREASELELAGRPVPPVLQTKRQIADKLVFSKLRERLGGRIRILVSGSAPLSTDISSFFAAAGLQISEGYGLTETSAGNSVNPPGQLRIGTVGRPLGDLEFKTDVDGEILIRGVAVMRGYHNLPDETAAAFTEDRFFRTGDIGEISPDGYIRITDRKKDLIKTSGGKYVAPSHIEGMFKAICPYTSQAILVGQARNYCTMLISLDPDTIKGWAAGGPLAGRSYAEIAASDEAREMVGGYIASLNEKLNRWETIKKFAILPRDLSIEDGELTPSLKIKRRAVETTFASEIDAMYAGVLAEI